MELLVVMPLMIIVTTLVLLTLVTAYGAESGVQVTSSASSQVTLAFMSLDNEVRYAADINEPWQDTNSPPDYFVAFQSNWTQDSQGQSGCTDVECCTEVEYTSAGALQQRSWPVNGSAPTGWQVLASGLQQSVSSSPFGLTTAPASAPSAPWQLSVSIAGVNSKNSPKAQLAFTITSLDTTANSLDSGVCGSPST